MRTLEGKRVLITGAASGIGLECARSFARQGARIVISDVDANGLAALEQDFLGAGFPCIAQPCDVTSATSVATLATVAHEAGPVDILVNNAGIAYLGSFEEQHPDWWRRTFEVNVLGIVHCIQAFLPAMRAAGGERKIVNVASLAGFMPAPNMAAYAASKHAVVGLSEVLALELFGTPISVLVVCPGIINTNIVNARHRVAASIGEAQLQKLQRYYVENGCLPNVVAEGIVRSVLDDQQYLFVGPMARLASLLRWLPPRLKRRLTIRDAGKAGYLP